MISENSRGYVQKSSCRAGPEYASHGAPLAGARGPDRTGRESIGRVEALRVECAFIHNCWSDRPCRRWPERARGALRVFGHRWICSGSLLDNSQPSLCSTSRPQTTPLDRVDLPSPQRRRPPQQPRRFTPTTSRCACLAISG